jgi:hypothetical protein
LHVGATAEGWCDQTYDLRPLFNSVLNVIVLILGHLYQHFDIVDVIQYELVRYGLVVRVDYFSLSYLYIIKSLFPLLEHLLCHKLAINKAQKS